METGIHFIFLCLLTVACSETTKPTKSDSMAKENRGAKCTLLDNGYYKLKITEDGTIKNESYGKFSTVLKKHHGEWKFFVDTNASSKEEEYQTALPIQLDTG